MRLTDLRRRRLAALICVSALATPLGIAHAQDDNGLRPKDNGALAIARQDGAKEFEFAWSLERQTGGAVDHLNVARAISDECSNCRATAIAMQIVLAVRAESVTPVNRAEAINNEADHAEAYAFAPQFVRVTNRPARFTGEGRATLADVRRELRSLEERDLPAEELIAAVAAQRKRVREVLDTQLVPIRGDRAVRTLQRRDRAPSDR
jgi:hypothetical protein